MRRRRGPGAGTAFASIIVVGVCGLTSNWTTTLTSTGKKGAEMHGRLQRALLRVCEVAKRLGISRSGVYAICARSELRHVRVMNCIRVAQSDLMDFLKSRRSGRLNVWPADGR